MTLGNDSDTDIKGEVDPADQTIAEGRVNGQGAADASKIGLILSS